MRGTWRSRRTLIVAVLLAGAGCGDASGPEQPGAVSLSASSSELTVGSSLQIVAAVLNATGAVMTSQQVQWNSLDPQVASVSSGGVVTGLTGGTARIRATAGTASGDISLRVRPAPCAPSSVGGSLAPGQTVTGSLSVSDCILMEGDHADAWSFSVTQPTGVRLELRSTQFETVLLVTDMAMNVVTFFGDRGMDGSARLVHQFTPGSYLVWVTSWGGGSTGSYSLSAETVTLCSAATTAGSLGVDQTVNGALTASSCLLPHGHAGQGWRLSAASGTTVRLDMQAPGFLPFLVVTDQHLNALAIGVPTSPGTAELLLSLPPGEYFVWATSINGGLGTYTLAMSTARLEPCTGHGGTVAPGQTVTGGLSHGSCRLPDGRYADPWQVTLPQATTLRIDMGSTQFDTYLLVTDQTGAIVAADDDGGFGTNSRIVQHFPAGSYTVWATTFATGEVGAYQLSVQATTSGSILERPRPAAFKATWPGQVSHGR
jgi:putative hemolysin